MKFLTIRQPWASLIAVGAKTIETRPFSTRYRGPLAIHAGKAPVPRRMWKYADGMFDDFWIVREDDETCLLDRRLGKGTVYDLLPLPLGAVVAVCDLVDVVPIAASAVDGERRIVNIEAPLPGGDGRVARLWDDDGRGCWAIDDQLPFGDFTPGRYAWLLDNVRPIDPVPMKGAQGLRDIPGDVLTQLLAQVVA